MNPCGRLRWAWLWWSAALWAAFVPGLPAANARPAETIPAAHRIAGVPWHVQINGLACGDGALDSVFDYFGPDIDQKAIADVARTSSIGTYTFDLLRAGHFSALSSAQGRFYPHAAPVAGFVERPVGYAAFSHQAEEPWLAELKALLAADIPVTLLMTYAADGTGGGHYRVAVGYDDDAGVMYFIDPWGRDLRDLPDQPGLIAWTYADVARGWNYAAYGSERPYFGVAILPWNVDVRVSGELQPGATVKVTALVHYPCPRPFDCTAFPAANAVATLELPAGMTALDPLTVTLGSGPPQSMAAGTTRSASWRVYLSKVPVARTELEVRAQGTVSGWVPEARWEGQGVVYPVYRYSDVIGGRGRFLF
jgi:hypothetical protein